MRLKRWFQGVKRSPASTVESSVKHADIHHEPSRLDAELATMRAELSALKAATCPWPGRMAAEISRAAEAALGQAIENFARALRSHGSPVRGRAGGLARARHAWRYHDGTFMPDREKEAAIEEYELENYERFAVGGRRRAATATRYSDGTFAPVERDTT